MLPLVIRRFPVGSGDSDVREYRCHGSNEKLPAGHVQTDQGPAVSEALLVVERVDRRRVRAGRFVGGLLAGQRRPVGARVNDAVDQAPLVRSTPARIVLGLRGAVRPHAIAVLAVLPAQLAAQTATFPPVEPGEHRGLLLCGLLARGTFALAPRAHDVALRAGASDPGGELLVPPRRVAAGPLAIFGRGAHAIPRPSGIVSVIAWSCRRGITCSCRRAAAALARVFSHARSRARWSSPSTEVVT